MSFIYLLSPYSHPLESVRRSRYEAAMDAVATMHRLEIPVYSPIVHWHKVGERHQLPGDHEHWLLQDQSMMKSCREGWILALSGWYESAGIRSEQAFLARELKIIRTVTFEILPAQCKAWKSIYATEKDQTKHTSGGSPSSQQQSVVSKAQGEGESGAERTLLE